MTTFLILLWINISVNRLKKDEHQCLQNECEAGRRGFLICRGSKSIIRLKMKETFLILNHLLNLLLQKGVLDLKHVCLELVSSCSQCQEQYFWKHNRKTASLLCLQSVFTSTKWLDFLSLKGSSVVIRTKHYLEIVLKEVS